MSARRWMTLSLPPELIAEIGELGRAEDRTRRVIVERAIALYRQQSER
ncbi:ribbon-helix-helix protein, CopG family [Mycobacterium sherrisii]|nr:ribbon-helix-helix protein, CopG family [Mycobacterium sherrisii]MEC4763822.1 ribbon-helix-helix protein, CopG family [Mycobacterium sherrisii]